MRDIKLEARIARLEKLLTTKVGKSVKNESNKSALSDEMHDQLEDIFDNRFCAGGYSGSHKNWKRDMEDLSNGECPKLVDDAIKWLVSDYHYNREELEYLRDDIASYFADMAADMIYDYDDWDEDEDYDDDDYSLDDMRTHHRDDLDDDDDEDDDIEEWDGTVPDVVKDMWAGTKWESRSCRRRTSKRSVRESYDEDDDLANLSDKDLYGNDANVDEYKSNRVSNRADNKDTLPDFSSRMFKTVADVLKAWAGRGTVGASSYNDDDALKRFIANKLIRAGVIDNAIRSNLYFKANNAIEAIIGKNGCWDDDLDGTADLWWNKNGTEVVLDLYPISGGKHGKLTLKLSWLKR